MKGIEPCLLTALLLGILLDLAKGVAVPGYILPKDNIGLFNNAEIEAVINPNGNESYSIIIPPGSRAAFTLELGNSAPGLYKVKLATKAEHPGMVSIGLVEGDVCRANGTLGAFLEEEQQLMEGDHVMEAGLLLSAGGLQL